MARSGCLTCWQHSYPRRSRKNPRRWAPARVYSVFGYQLGAAKFHRDFMDAGALVEEAPPVLEKQGPIVWDDAQHVAVENEESQVVGESFLFHL